MTGQAGKLSLFDGLQLSGMTPGELWLGYYSVGGNASELEVEAYVLGLLRPDAYQHNLIAQAINERAVTVIALLGNWTPRTTRS